MSKENEKKRTLYGQFAWIVNYQPKIEHQHIHMGDKPNKEETGTKSPSQAENAEVVEEVTGCETKKSKLVIAVTEVAKSFRFQNDFVKKKVADVVHNYYKGSHANLALIEITLYDHNQLIKRNFHKAFVKALVAWGLIEVIDEEELKKVVSAVTDKHNRMPKEGYLKWDDNYADDKYFCEKIGRELGDTMPYKG